MSEFTISFFELCFLAEVCVPPVPIARGSFFDDLSDIHYHKMSQNERLRIFEWISPKLDLTNDYCKVFHDRFNPDNQYRISYEYGGKSDSVDCYKHGGKYHTSKNQHINEEYIKSVEKI